MTTRFLFISLMTLAICLSCQTTMQQEGFKIEGGWFFVKDDSIYQEVVFDHAKFFSYDENHGVYFGYYKLRGDSLCFYSHAGRLTLSAQVTYLMPNKLFIKTKYYSAIYNRLHETIDTTLIFQNNEDYISEYVTAYLTRKYKFESD